MRRLRAAGGHQWRMNSGGGADLRARIARNSRRLPARASCSKPSAIGGGVPARSATSTDRVGGSDSRGRELGALRDEAQARGERVGGVQPLGKRRRLQPCRFVDLTQRTLDVGERLAPGHAVMGRVERHVQRPRRNREHGRRVARDRDRFAGSRQRPPRGLVIDADALQPAMEIDDDSVEIAAPVAVVLLPPGRERAIVDEPLEPEPPECLAGRVDIRRGDPDVAVQIGVRRIIGVPLGQRRALQEDAANARGFEGSQDLGGRRVDPEIARGRLDAGRLLNAPGMRHTCHLRAEAGGSLAKTGISAHVTGMIGARAFEIRLSRAASRRRGSCVQG